MEKDFDFDTECSTASAAEPSKPVSMEELTKTTEELREQMQQSNANIAEMAVGFGMKVFPAMFPGQEWTLFVPQETYDRLLSKQCTGLGDDIGLAADYALEVWSQCLDCDERGEGE